MGGCIKLFYMHKIEVGMVAFMFCLLFSIA